MPLPSSALNSSLLNSEHLSVIRILCQELDEGSLAIFAGPGLSQPADTVPYQPMTTAAALPAKAAAESQSPPTQHTPQMGAHHLQLTRLPIQSFWTTNSDTLIEDALVASHKSPDVKSANRDLSYTKPNRDATVYKIPATHWDRLEHRLTPQDHLHYRTRLQAFISALSGDLISKTFLFVGISFNDPTFEYVIKRLRVNHVRDQRPHFCIIQRAQHHSSEGHGEFYFRLERENRLIAELGKLGIRCMMVDDFATTAQLLTALEQCHKSKTVFISGAAHTYAPFSKEASERFLYELSRDLISEGYRISCGFGLGVGSAVISGAIEQTLMRGERLSHKHLVLHPFPQDSAGQMAKADVWREYRESILDLSGVAIFVFGNKLVGDSVVLADGMVEEFELAQRKGLFVIPVGATGYAASILWKRVSSEFKTHQHRHGTEVQHILERLAQPTADLLWVKQEIIRLLKLI